VIDGSVPEKARDHLATKFVKFGEIALMVLYSVGKIEEGATH
jgi:hypothetical protein